VQGDKLKLTGASTSGSADFSTSPAEGGAQWKAHFTWKIPQTIVAGTKLAGGIQLGVTVSNVQPDQPLQQGIKGFAPGFAEQIIAAYPATASVSKSYDYTLSAGTTGAFTITIEAVSSTVTYHYAPKPTTHTCKRPQSAYAPSARQAGCSAAVAFLFTQSGRPPNVPTRVLDVRTVGHGSGRVELTTEGFPIRASLELKTARVVLERDYFTAGGDRATQRLVFALAKNPDESFYGGPPGARGIVTGLMLVDSSDPSCTEGSHTGVREATLNIKDRGDDEGKDRVSLTVAGCHHESFSVEGTKRVNVVITLK